MKQMFVQFRGENLNRQGVSNFDWSIFQILDKNASKEIPREKQV